MTEIIDRTEETLEQVNNSEKRTVYFGIARSPGGTMWFSLGVVEDSIPSLMDKIRQGVYPHKEVLVFKAEVTIPSPEKLLQENLEESARQA